MQGKENGFIALGPDFFYLLIYGRASPKILAPPEK